MSNVTVRYRIKNSQQILEIKRFGDSFSDSNLVLVIKRNNLTYSRYTVIASKVVGGAVQRNRCKRRIRHRADNILDKIKPCFDLLFIARQATLSCSPTELDNSIYTLLSRANLLDTDEFANK